MDLSLVPLDDIIEEICKRHDTYVLATLRTEEGNQQVVKTYFTDGHFLDSVGMCSILDQEIKDFHMHYELDVEEEE